MASTWHEDSGTRIRVAINEGGFMFAQDSLSVFIGLRYSETDTRVVRFTQEGSMLFEDVSGPVTTNPTIIIPRDFAYALMNALVRHFDGTDDTRQLRRDLEYERKRSDELQDGILTFLKMAVDKIPDSGHGTLPHNN